MGVIPRRRFLQRTVQGMGILSFAIRPSSAQTEEPATTADLAAKAVAFLRPRQGSDGSWSGDLSAQSGGGQVWLKSSLLSPNRSRPFSVIDFL
jgi:hypothetical protein